MRKKVALATAVHPVLTDWLEHRGYELIPPGTPVQRAIRQCEGLIISNQLKVDSALIDAAPQLRWIARVGSGMEIVDVGYATAKGITCLSSPDGNANAVAEHTLGLLLSLTKNIDRAAGEVRQGLWQREPNRGWELEGKTIGIIGYGHTGSALARKLSGWDMRVLARDIDERKRYPQGVMAASLSEIEEQAEILSFHLPLQDSTRHYFNRDLLQRMQRPFFLLNTSRGEIVEEEALVEGLVSQKIRGAGLDVWTEEPPQFQEVGFKGLLERPNVILTPHIAGYSEEAKYKMALSLLGKLKALLGAEMSEDRQ